MNRANFALFIQILFKVIEEQKRCVTLQWLNDILAKKRLEPPWRVAHLPTCYSEKRPALNKVLYKFYNKCFISQKLSYAFLYG